MNISSLTKAQQIESGKIYCGSEGAYANPQTLKALVNKGLIERKIGMIFKTQTYYVPLSVHYMVTQWAAEGLLDGDSND